MYTDKWDLVHLSHKPLEQDELDERAEVTAEVTDPTWAPVELDAEGEDAMVDIPATSQNGHAVDVIGGD